MFAGVVQAQTAPRSLDGFENQNDWKVVVSNQVTGKLRQAQGVDGKALCLDYDFNGVSGYVGIQRDLPVEYPGNYQFKFDLRGDSPKNDLQFKLIDASGDNVWWVNRPKYDYPRAWSEVRYKKRHIDKAWGPDPDRALRSSAKLEYTIYNNEGGKGSVCFDRLRFEPLPPEDRSSLKASASSTAANGGAIAARTVDGKRDTAWIADFATEPAPSLTLDLGKPREFGGLVLRWTPREYASDYLVQTSDDGKAWRDVRTVVGGDGGADYLALPESEARYLRVLPGDGPQATFGLEEAAVQPLEFAATPNDFVRSVAKDSPRGWYPRGFIGEQPYWTILGIDGGEQQGLIGEDGAVEVAQGGFSIEPFVIADGALVTWADVQASQSLQDGYLPIPSVDWKHPEFSLKTTAFARGESRSSQLVVRYRLANTGKEARDFILALAVRPLQVNPPTQFLNTVGGVSAIRNLEIEGNTVSVDGQRRVFAGQTPDASFVSAFDSGSAVAKLDDGERPQTKRVDDPTGLASGALLYRLPLAPGEWREISLLIPMTGAAPKAIADAESLQQAAAADWRGKLDRVHIDVPPQGQALADTLRTATAHMLVSRIGPRLQPGTRSYARSWIRDGAMISEGLLRMGREDAVKDYVAWYAPYQFKDGMVPCCVDRRGSDPVPENDSHGELIFNIAELYRYNGDKAFLAKMWPHVLAAFGYMEKLRLSERTEANKAKNAAFYGMMPVSISHEGYSAKPVHSYWDNFWALRGYKDAVEVAQWLGKTAEAKRFAASRDQFRDDLYASLQATAANHKIDYLAGSAELGDFDATSTTIALAPGGEQGRLPKTLLENTFQRYWREFVQRRDGKRQWDAYTPYEWRNVAAFVRLGWRDRAQEAVDYFFADREPAAWNQWAEVVARERRKPFFVGDLPHAWVASDFVRSALDMFAYVREVDDSIVLAAGIPADWLDGKGIAIRDLRTPNGKLGYSLRREGSILKLDITQGVQLPSGGLILPWPYRSEPGEAKIDGKAVRWENRELRIRAAPARIEIQIDK
ncbi:MAG TPA: discoidin domain-containing protein [Luteimonas sp.]|nr:discoidin domain-containing protein [Luteimonas sp.]